MNNLRVSTILFSSLVMGHLFCSCSNEIEKKQVPEVSANSNPCPPALNMDSLKWAIRNQVREEERRGIFMEARPENNSYFYGDQSKTNYTYSEKTNIYSEPDTNSKVLKVLPFCSSVPLIEGLNKKEFQGYYWMKTRHPEDANKFGYIRDKDLADFMEPGYGTQHGFLVGEADTLMEGYKNRVVEIRRYKENSHTILEKYKTRYKASGYRFHKVHNSTLKGVRYGDKNEYGTLFVYETFRQSCPGGGMTEFIIDDGKKLVTVTTVSTEGEGGYYNYETAYIPMRFGNGKILLVGDASLQNIFNWQTADLNVFPYSTDYKVPIENMVVVKHENNGYDDADMEEDPEKAKVITKTTIYEWNGKKLIKIKEY